MQPLLHSSKTLHVSLPFWLNPVIVLFARRTSEASGEFKRSRGRDNDNYWLCKTCCNHFDPCCYHDGIRHHSGEGYRPEYHWKYKVPFFLLSAIFLKNVFIFFLSFILSENILLTFHQKYIALFLHIKKIQVIQVQQNLEEHYWMQYCLSASFWSSLACLSCFIISDAWRYLPLILLYYFSFILIYFFISFPHLSIFSYYCIINQIHAIHAFQMSHLLTKSYKHLHPASPRMALPFVRSATRTFRWSYALVWTSFFQNDLWTALLIRT